jgi:hypothetical protein
LVRLELTFGHRSAAVEQDGAMRGIRRFNLIVAPPRFVSASDPGTMTENQAQTGNDVPVDDYRAISLSNDKSTSRAAKSAPDAASTIQFALPASRNHGIHTAGQWLA